MTIYVQSTTHLTSFYQVQIPQHGLPLRIIGNYLQSRCGTISQRDLVNHRVLHGLLHGISYYSLFVTRKQRSRAWYSKHARKRLGEIE